jgi:hypothetical protein
LLDERLSGSIYIANEVLAQMIQASGKWRTAALPILGRGVALSKIVDWEDVDFIIMSMRNSTTVFA